MRSFREILEDKAEDFENDEPFSKQDLIDLIQEQDLDEDDIAEITELVMEIVEYGDFDGDDFDADNFDWDNYDWDEDEDELYEKMSNKAKKDAAKRRRKPAFKKAMKKKKKCEAKHAEKIKKSKKGGVPMVCNVKGKLVKGMSRADRRKLAKTRKKNKNKIIK